MNRQIMVIVIQWILFSNKKEQTPDIRNNREESQIHSVRWNNARLKRLNTASFHLNEILEKAQLKWKKTDEWLPKSGTGKEE